MSIATIWGTTEEERARAFPCDALLPEANAAYYRGVTVRARPDIVFRWLCQMRVAPYSYDWIDNVGRQSPRHLTPGLDDLAVGQRIMTTFELVDFDRNHHLTGRVTSRTFGDLAVTYLIASESAGSCRLLVKMVVAYPPGLLSRIVRVLLPWGDLVMMRRQLLNFKELAERTPLELDSFLPTYDFSERHSTVVRAPRDAVRRAAEEWHPSESWLWRPLLIARGLGAPKGTLREWAQSMSFLSLADTEDEMVYAQAGRFWALNERAALVSPRSADELLALDDPGAAVGAMSVRFESIAPDRTRVSTETRVRALGPQARRRFRLYWLLIRPFSGLLRRSMLAGIKKKAERG